MPIRDVMILQSFLAGRILPKQKQFRSTFKVGKLCFGCLNRFNKTRKLFTMG